MQAQTVVALVAASLAAIISVTVPWMTFRLALRQDQIRWLREQRSQLYVDLLTEAYAEQQYLDYDMADDETRSGMRFVDLRLPDVERARLGARATIFASKPVNQLFTRLQGVALLATLNPKRDEGHRITARMQVGSIMDELQATIRRELGADRIQDVAAAKHGH